MDTTGGRPVDEAVATLRRHVDRLLDEAEHAGGGSTSELALKDADDLLRVMHLLIALDGEVRA